jgi:hypothetical protein
VSIVTYPVLAAVRPASIGNADNGRITADVLVNVGGPLIRLLAVEAATEYIALRDACVVDTGVVFAVMGGGAYRSFAEQLSLFAQRYEYPARTGLPASSYRTYGERTYSLRSGMAAAASPGTSNHGLGVAVDIAIPVIDTDTGKITSYTRIDQSKLAWPWLLGHAVEHGWSWELQSEPWHLHLITLRGATPAPVIPPAKGGQDMLYCEDADTGNFWAIYFDSVGRRVTCPLAEMPDPDWDEFAAVQAAFGPLAKVPHAALQRLYDKRGRPTVAVGTVGPVGPVGPAAPPHHHTVEAETGES